MTEIRVRVPWDVNRTSKNQRLHWRERARRNKLAREAAAFGWRQAGCPHMDGPARVTLIVRRGRRLDQENALGGAAAATDQLCTRRRTGEGVLMDDGPDWLEWAGIEQQCGKQWAARPEIEYVFTPREENP